MIVNCAKKFISFNYRGYSRESPTYTINRLFRVHYSRFITCPSRLSQFVHQNITFMLSNCAKIAVTKAKHSTKCYRTVQTQTQVLGPRRLWSLGVPDRLIEQSSLPAVLIDPKKVKSFTFSLANKSEKSHTDVVKTLENVRELFSPHLSPDSGAVIASFERGVQFIDFKPVPFFAG